MSKAKLFSIEETTHLQKYKIGCKFENIEYLKAGNDKQRRAYFTLNESQILTVLQKFDPILVGTIPINIDIDNSDLDIICYVKNQHDFIHLVQNNFSSAAGFEIRKLDLQIPKAVVINFKLNEFEIEIFGQNIPTKQQYAYQHMIIENKILFEKGEIFRQQIIDLKKQGLKTEPAFAIALGLTGNPYFELLSLKNNFNK